MYIQKIHAGVRVFNVYTCVKVPIRSGPQRQKHLFMSKTKVLNIRIDPELKKKAKKLAEADGRSLSNWVTKLISSTVKDAERESGKKEK